MNSDELDTIPPSGEPQTSGDDPELEALRPRKVVSDRAKQALKDLVRQGQVRERYRAGDGWDGPGPVGIVGGFACEAVSGDAESAESGGE